MNGSYGTLARAVAGMKKGTSAEVPFFMYLARPERFERPTPWFVAKYSIQLSYGRAVRAAHYTCSSVECKGFSGKTGL